MKLFLIGGFLGSGKTTAIQQACSVLREKGEKVAVITNDQGTQLVDSLYIKSFGIPVKEVTGGCFCCRFDELINSILSVSKAYHPQVIFAESVGSCTDLVATIAKPLAQLQPQVEVVISVFADAYLLYSIMTGSSCFLDEQVQYIYKKQLEEADIIVLNKIDLLDTEAIKTVCAIIQADYPGKTIIHQNSLEKEGLQQWLQKLYAFSTTINRKSLAMDYDCYAEGEAKLAWLDKEIIIQSENEKAFDIAFILMEKIYQSTKKQNFTIGHLKFFLNDGEQQHKISFTTTTTMPAIKIKQRSKKHSVTLFINARVQAAPTQLESMVAQSITEIKAQAGCIIIEKQTAAFKPGYPKPMHRMLT